VIGQKHASHQVGTVCQNNTACRFFSPDMCGLVESGHRAFFKLEAQAPSVGVK